MGTPKKMKRFEEQITARGTSSYKKKKSSHPEKSKGYQKRLLVLVVNVSGKRELNIPGRKKESAGGSNWGTPCLGVIEERRHRRKMVDQHNRNDLVVTKGDKDPLCNGCSS